MDGIMQLRSFASVVLAVLGLTHLGTVTQLWLSGQQPSDVPLLSSPSANGIVRDRFFFEENVNAKASLQRPPAAHAQLPKSEPFGLATLPVAEGGMWSLWRNMQAKIVEESRLLSGCRVDPAECPSDAALRFEAIVDEARKQVGRARIGAVNRSINLSIRPMNEPTWTTPLQTLDAGVGDCKHYAIAKYVALLEAGISDKDLRIVIVHDSKVHENHAMVAARLDGHWFSLDNRWLVLVEDVDLTRYLPMYVMNGDGVRRFVPVPRQQEQLNPVEAG